MRLGRLVDAAVVGYLLGTVPSADIAARRASGGSIDLREVGSGNPGGTNAMKVLGRKYGIAVMAADVGKGAVAGVAGRALAGRTGAHLASSAAVIGHCFPVWSGFRGGKGVGTSAGQCLATFPAYFPVDCAVAAATITVAKAKDRAFMTMVVTSIAWVGAGLLWWRKGWRNAWGPKPTAALPFFAAVSSGVILYRFATATPPVDPAVDHEGIARVIGICTDSSSQLPPSLAERYGIEVVPVTIRIGEHEYLEGVDLDTDSFYARFDVALPPDMAMAPPSPGQFALAYEHLVQRGATEILSLHIGSGISGGLNSARLAARHSSVPVRLVDTGTASFGVGGCTWAAAEAVAAGASLDRAAALAEALGPEVGNVFVIRARDLINPGAPMSAGRVAVGAPPVPVLSFVDGKVTVLERAASFDETVARMADYATAWRRHPGRGHLNVAIGVADVGGEPLAEALASALRSSRAIHELVHFRIGPSVGVQTGPAAVGAFFYRV